MSLLALEQAVIAQLQTVEVLGALKVEPYPDASGDYISRNPRGAVLVAIAGSRYGEMINGMQQRTARLVITLLLRNLSSHTGVYALLDAITGTLNGWQPNSWQPLTVVEERFVVHKDGVWQYDVWLDAQTRVISNYERCM